jgi:adenylate kinase family enzyme
MKRVVILGRGGSGKSTLAARMGALTGLPVIELDEHFWRPGLQATPPEQWAAVQRELVRDEGWIMDGDLGPYDVLDVRLQAADTVILLDYSFWRCAWRAIRRSRQRADFWRWVWSYRRRSRPYLLAAIRTHASDAELYVIRSPHALKRFLAAVPTGRP